MINLLKNTIDRNITVVVRGVNERTESLCVQLLAMQISSKNIHLIHETPFSKAVRKTFEIGINQNRKWTLVVDADILVKSNIVKEFYKKAEDSPDSVFILHTQMLDKFFGGTRAGGLKLYRTKFLEEALKIVPEVANRPEGFVAKAMHKRGFYLEITDLVCGLHDFEQFYLDIFRKGFAHGIKHKSLLTALMPYWERMSKQDKDFAVLLAGFEVARPHNKELRLDKDEVKAQFDEYMNGINQTEKTKISPGIDSNYIDSLLRNFVPPVEYKVIRTAIEDQGRPEIPQKA